MPRQRPVKTLLVEAILFIGLVVVVGHIGVDFWERFVIQSELKHMKTSLHSLGETLANIGNAYDRLHNNLNGILEITEKQRLQTKPDHAQTKLKQHIPPPTLDRRRQHDIQLRAMLQDKRADKVPNVHTCVEYHNIHKCTGSDKAKADKTTENLLQENTRVSKGISNIRAPNLDKTTEKEEHQVTKSTENESMLKYDKATDNKVHLANKRLDAIPNKNPLKNATTITRYPPRSTAVGQEHYRERATKDTCRYQGTSNKHRCYRGIEYCQGLQQPYYNYSCDHWAYRKLEGSG